MFSFCPSFLHCTRRQNSFQCYDPYKTGEIDRWKKLWLNGEIQCLIVVKEYPSVHLQHPKCQGWIWIYFVFHMCELRKYPSPVSLVVLVINPWPKTRNSITVEDEMFKSQICLKVVWFFWLVSLHLYPSFQNSNGVSYKIATKCHSWCTRLILMAIALCTIVLAICNFT